MNQVKHSNWTELYKSFCLWFLLLSDKYFQLAILRMFQCISVAHLLRSALIKFWRTQITCKSFGNSRATATPCRHKTAKLISVQKHRHYLIDKPARWLLIHAHFLYFSWRETFLCVGGCVVNQRLKSDWLTIMKVDVWITWWTTMHNLHEPSKLINISNMIWSFHTPFSDHSVLKIILLLTPLRPAEEKKRKKNMVDLLRKNTANFGRDHKGEQLPATRGWKSTHTQWREQFRRTVRVALSSRFFFCCSKWLEFLPFTWTFKFFQE